MRGAVLGSGFVHLALLAGLWSVRHEASLIVPGPDVVQVALIDPTAVTPPAPPAAEPPKIEPKPVEIKPLEDEGVKLKPEKPRKKEARKEPEMRREPPAAAAGLPTAAVGSAGLLGDVALDAGNFEFTYYLILVRNKIASNWSPPAGLVTGGRPVRSVVYFKVARGGEISGIRLESGSGADFFDRSALRAVLVSDPLPPLPLGYTGSELGVHFGFEWESP